MEARISDRLRSISSLRHMIVERIQLSLSSPYLQILQHPVFIHFSLIVTTLTIIISIYAHTRSVTLFSFHPVFMTIGAILLFGEGIAAYRNKILLETLSPIMQHNKTTKVRAIHQTCQVLGSSFLFLGLMFIFANKIEFNESLVPKSIHSTAGSLLLVIIIAQVISGDQKLTNYTRSNMTIRRWHSDAGLLVWDLICITILLGIFDFLKISMAFLLDLFTICLSWYVIQLQMLRKSETDEGNADKEGSNLNTESPSDDIIESSGNSPLDVDEFIP